MKKTSFIHFTLFILLSLWQTVAAQEEINFQHRQKLFMDHMNKGAAFIFGSDRINRLNNNFYYLTGDTNRSMVLFLCPDCEIRSQLFSANPEASQLPVKELPDYFRTQASQEELLWISFDDPDKLKSIGSLLGFKREIKNTAYLFYQMREIKDSAEIGILSKAIDITATSYQHILKMMKPGMTEKSVVELFKQKQADLGARATSFIQAGSGHNGTNIHAQVTDKIIEKGDLVVFDVGAWYQGYTSDISRTYPAGGKFSRNQKEIYQLVLNAQKAGIDKMKPGQIMYEVQKTVEDVLIEGLFKLGLITDVSSNWQRQLYLVHGYYHYIGLDIHDCYPYMHREIKTKKYQPGMVMTMEPGLYFPAGLLDKKPSRADDLSDEEFIEFVKATRDTYKKYQNMGVRIEDDVLITKDGNIVLSGAVPKEIKEIEKIMK
jgi:Xaa-Pro aminopeptidase